MPTTKVIKPKPVAATRGTLERTKPVQVRAVSGAQSELRVPGPGRPRASSCPRSPRPDRSERTTAKTGSERRSRSSSTAPQTTATWPRTNPDHRKTTSPAKHVAVNPKHRDVSACPGQREQRGGRTGGRTETGTGTGTGTGRAGHSHKAFTVIPPNPKKRREIQRKAEAELAALEELRLSRAMAYVSICPSSVGGCMSLEEVRLKQQQEMMQAKKKQKPVKAQVTERTPVLRS